MPYTLAENAGLSPIETVTELRRRHAEGATNTGINVRTVSAFHSHCLLELYTILQGYVDDITKENVLQPLLVSQSAIQFATETVRSILKIDDILQAMR